MHNLYNYGFYTEDSINEALLTCVTAAKLSDGKQVLTELSNPTWFLLA